MKLSSLNISVAIFATALLSSEAGADVIDSSGHGFTVRNSATIARPAAMVYSRLLQIGRWWDSAHTYSGNARNLSLEGRANGAFSEQLKGGGSILHGVVLYADPGKTLRLSTALGPLQSLAATGTLTWTLTGDRGETQVEMLYSVGGYDPKGFRGLPSIVDMVLSTQLHRLKRYVETGSPSSR